MKQRFLLTSVICLMASSLVDNAIAAKNNTVGITKNVINVQPGGSLTLSNEYPSTVVRNQGNACFTGKIKIGGAGVGTALINGGIDETTQAKIPGDVVIDENTTDITNSEGKAEENIPSVYNIAGDIVQLAGYVGAVNNYSTYYFGGGKIRSFNQQTDNLHDASGAILDIIGDSELTLKSGNYLRSGVINVGFTDEQNNGEHNSNGKITVNGGTIIAGDDAATFNLLNDQYLEEGNEDSWKGGILEINKGSVVLDGGAKLDRVKWVGDIYLNGGELTLRNIIDDSASPDGKLVDADGKIIANKGGEIIATEGTLRIGEGVVLNEEDSISDKVKIIAEGGLKSGKGSSIYLNSNDTEIKGKVSVDGGELITRGFETNDDCYVVVESGGLRILPNENDNKKPGLIMSNDNDFIAGDCTSVINAPLQLKAGTFHLNDLVDPESPKENQDSVDSAISIEGGKFVGKSILINTDEGKTFNQTKGETYLTDSILRINPGSCISGGTIVHEAVDVTPAVESKGGGLLKSNVNSGVNNNNGFTVNTLTLLQAPVRRLNAAKSVGKTIPVKQVSAGETELTISNNTENNATIVSPNEENGKFYLIVKNSSNELQGKQKLKASGNLNDESVVDNNTKLTLNKDSSLQKGQITIGDGINNNELILKENAVIGKDMPVSIKESSKLVLDGSETKVVIDADNPNTEISGKYKLQNGELVFIGDLNNIFSTANKEGETKAKLKNKQLLKDNKGELGSEEEYEDEEGEEEEDDTLEKEGDKYISEIIETEKDNEVKSDDISSIENSSSVPGSETIKDSQKVVDLLNAKGNIKADDDHQLNSDKIITGKEIELFVEGNGLSGIIENEGSVTFKNAKIGDVLPVTEKNDKSQNTEEENEGEKEEGEEGEEGEGGDDGDSGQTTKEKLTDGIANIYENNTCNRTFIQSKLNHSKDAKMTFNGDECAFILTEQDKPLKCELEFKKGTHVLSTNDQKINKCVTINENAKVTFTSGTIGAVKITKGGCLVLNNGDNINGDIIIKKGVRQNKGGTLIVEGDDIVLGDILLYEGKVNLKKDLHFGSVPTYGNPSTDSAYFKQYGGQLTITNCTITLDDLSVLFGDPKFEGAGQIKFGDSMISADGTAFASTVNTINGAYDHHATTTKTIIIGKEGTNNVDFSIDVYGRSKSNAKFDDFGNEDGKTSMKATGDSATVNISDFALNGDLFGEDAPIDASIPMKIFNVASSDGITFTSSNKEKLTAIGYYALKPAGNGVYNLTLTKYNPGIFRDQIGMTAINQNQATLNDGVFSHITATDVSKDHEYLQGKTDGKKKNIWIKVFGGHENLHLQTDVSNDKNGIKEQNKSSSDNSKDKKNNDSGTSLPDITNNTYGALLGIDLTEIEFKDCWTFAPSIFAGYIGSDQSYEIGTQKFKSRQDGGELGFAGLLSNGKVSIGTMVYGGYFRNKMTLPNNNSTGTNTSSDNSSSESSNSKSEKKESGKSENVNHGLFGGSVKIGYNFSASDSVTVQPNVSATYNYVSGGKWKSTYGSMEMVSEKLNGFSLLPGLDIIFSNKQMSVVISAKYVLSIDKSCTGKAGNVLLPNLLLNKKGYMQYGLGINFTTGNNFNAALQATFRHIGRTGFGVTLHLNWKF